MAQSHYNLRQKQQQSLTKASSSSSSSNNNNKKKTMMMKKNYEGFYLLTKLVDGGQGDGETIKAHFNHILTRETVYPYSLRLTAAAAGDEKGGLKNKILYDLGTKISNSISVRLQRDDDHDEQPHEEEEQQDKDSAEEEDWMIPSRVSMTQMKPGHDWKIENIVKKVLCPSKSQKKKYRLGISLQHKSENVAAENEDDDGGNTKKEKEDSSGHGVELIIRNPDDGSAIHCIRYTT